MVSYLQTNAEKLQKLEDKVDAYAGDTDIYDGDKTFYENIKSISKLKAVQFYFNPNGNYKI